MILRCIHVYNLFFSSLPDKTLLCVTYKARLAIFKLVLMQKLRNERKCHIKNSAMPFSGWLSLLTPHCWEEDTFRQRGPKDTQQSSNKECIWTSSTLRRGWNAEDLKEKKKSMQRNRIQMTDIIKPTEENCRLVK